MDPALSHTVRLGRPTDRTYCGLHTLSVAASRRHHCNGCQSLKFTPDRNGQDGSRRNSDCNRNDLAGFAAAHYWSSSSYSWPSGRALEMRQSEAVNNSAALEMILVDKVMKKLLQWFLGKKARTGPLRMCIADRSTILTILSSGAGRVFIRNESSDEEPVRGLKQ